MLSNFRMPGRTTDVFFSLLLHCPSWRYQRELHDGSRMYGPSVGDETGSQWDFMRFLTSNAAQMNSSCSEYAVTEHSL